MESTNGGPLPRQVDSIRLNGYSHLCCHDSARHVLAGRPHQDERRTDMAGILSSWLTPGEVRDLVSVAGLGVVTLLVRYVGAYALLARCIRHTRPEDRSEVLHAVAEVLLSLRGKRSVRRPADHEAADGAPLTGTAEKRDK